MELDFFPQVCYNSKEWAPTPGAPISIDFEFQGDRPTRLGLSSGQKPLSIPWGEEAQQLCNQLVQRGYRWVGHNALDADKPFLDAIAPTTLDKWDDTYILFYLTNSFFCGETGLKEQDDKGAFGLLGLWPFSSLYTDLPGWKKCRDGLGWGDAPQPRHHCAGPCPVHDVAHYNGLDALAVDVGLSRVQQEFREKGISEKTYSRVKELMLVSRDMREQGIKVDWGKIRQLGKDLEERKAGLFPVVNYIPRCKKCTEKGTKEPCGVCRRMKPREKYDAPFNPNSPKQVTEYLRVAQSTKEELEKALRSAKKGSEQEEWLSKLLEYKLEGKDLNAWFGESYEYPDGLCHPRFNPCGTSTGRFSSAGPNFQNIPTKGFGERVREAIVARDPGLRIARADFKNLELRVVLWYASRLAAKSFPHLGYDAFEWIIEQSPEIWSDLARELKTSERGAAKSFTHAANYLEGIRIYERKWDWKSRTHYWEFETKRNRDLISRGALRIHEEWGVGDGVVGFTGTNLARRLFGSASDENRARALQIQETYFSHFPEIRTWHKSLARDVERGFIRSNSGRYLQLVGDLGKRYKNAAAFLGQGGGADYAQEAMIKHWRAGHTPLVVVHDEEVVEVPRDWDDGKVVELMKVMEEPSQIFEGFHCPVRVEVGENWKDLEAIG